MSILRRKIIQKHFAPTRAALARGIVARGGPQRQTVANMLRKKRATLGAQKTRDYLIRKTTQENVADEKILRIEFVGDDASKGSARGGDPGSDVLQDVGDRAKRENQDIEDILGYDPDQPLPSFPESAEPHPAGIEVEPVDDDVPYWSTSTDIAKTDGPAAGSRVEYPVPAVYDPEFAAGQMGQSTNAMGESILSATLIEEGAAGATTAAGVGGAGGGGGGAVTAAGTAGAAGAGAAAFVGPLAIAIGAVVAGLVLMTGAILEVTEALEGMFEALVREFENIDPEIASARAQQEVELVMRRLEVSPSDAAVNVIEAQTAVQLELVEIRANLINIIAPVLTTLLTWVSKIFNVLNMFLEMGAKFMEFAYATWGKTNEFLKWIPSMGMAVSYMLDAMRKLFPDKSGEDEWRKEIDDFFGNLENRTSQGSFNRRRPRHAPAGA